MIRKIYNLDEMQVRVRSAGEGGCGHSDWSKAGVIAMPESQTSSQLTSSSRSASSYSLDREAAASLAGPSGASEGDDNKRKPSKLAGTTLQLLVSQLSEKSPLLPDLASTSCSSRNHDLENA